MVLSFLRIPSILVIFLSTNHLIMNEIKDENVSKLVTCSFDFKYNQTTTTLPYTYSHYTTQFTSTIR